MEFGKILDLWHKNAGPIYNKDAEFSGTTENSPNDRITSANRRKRLLRKSPEATIDLHGLTRDEAWNALSVFFDDARNKGLEKVLIIHGKGNHTGISDESGQRGLAEQRFTAGENGNLSNSGILKKLVRNFIERCPFAGESGYSDGRSGGEGSSWVLLKESRPGNH